MELNDLIFLGACAILSRDTQGDRVATLQSNRNKAIADAIKLAKEVWGQVIERRKE